MPTSQTLSRGIRVLEIVASSPVNLSIAEIAAKLEVHRSIAYRIIRTLEQHHLLNRDEAGHIRSASGLAVLARSVQRDLGCSHPGTDSAGQRTVNDHLRCRLGT